MTHSGNKVGAMAEVDQSPEDWFVVIDGTLGEDDEQPDEEPEFGGAPAAFLRRLRELVPAWVSLGLDWEDTFGSYANGRLTVAVDIVDQNASMSFGAVRVEVTDSEWVGAWVSPSLSTQPTLADAGPEDQAGGPIAGEADVDAPVAWLEAQLRRPVNRYIWRDDGKVVAERWRLEDTGRGLVVSGPKELWSRPETATETAHVRP